jgi:hypothetical protein
MRAASPALHPCLAPPLLLWFVFAGAVPNSPAEQALAAAEHAQKTAHAHLRQHPDRSVPIFDPTRAYCLPAPVPGPLDPGG